MPENTSALFSALEIKSKSIIKILRINVDTDSFDIIKTLDTEMTDERGFAPRISDWLRTFAESGQVHPSDVSSYLHLTSPEYLKNYFKSSESVWQFRYRRKTGDDFIWVMMEMYPTENFSEDNCELYLYVENVDNDLFKRWTVLQSVAGSYNTMHVFHLRNRTITEVSANKIIHDYFEMHMDNELQELVSGAMKATVTMDFQPMVLDFVDLDKLNERMMGRKSISIEFLGAINGWTRASFIRLNDDIFSELDSVIYTTQIIDEEKRREEALVRISKTDELTGLYNRRAYDRDLEKIAENGMKDDIVLIAFDLNGLKHANDTYGHSAGDELIKGAARCLLAAFAGSGRVYRTGGDEFSAIVYGSYEDILRMLEALDHITEQWHGVQVNELNISKGVASHAEFPEASVSDLEKISDERMYKDKDIYYQTHDVKRRVE